MFKNSDSDLVDIDLQSIIQLSNIPKLDNTTADFLDRNISEGENVLKGMKNNKSPGSDGFTAEFYNFFWNDLKTYIKNAMKDAIFMHGQLSVSQRLRILSYLPKVINKGNFKKKQASYYFT